MKTARGRFTRGLRALKEWMARARHWPIEQQAEVLGPKLLGHYRYYGVPGDSSSITRFLHEVTQRWQRAQGRPSCSGDRGMAADVAGRESLYWCAY